MNVIYDNHLKIAGLSLQPITRTGPERWFDDYKIISLEDWDEQQSVDVYPLTKDNERPAHRLQSLVDSNRFSNLISGKLSAYDLFIGKPQNIPSRLVRHKLLMLDKNLARQIENKAKVREYFGNVLPFPEYKTYEINRLSMSDFNSIMNSRPAVIMQAENSSSGKGTFKITSQASYIKTVRHLKRLGTDRLVVSRYIEEAEELSTQACITKQAVIVGPLHRQLINNPLLCNPDLMATEKFCGGLIDRSDQDSLVAATCRSLTKKVGLSLKKIGYKGIFGIDFLYDHQNLYAIEINARPTGLTALLSGLDLPILLLHILEVGNYDYRLEGEEFQLTASAGLFILHSKSGLKHILKSSLPSGTYKLVGEGLEIISRSVRLSELKSHEIILENYCLPGGTVLPGCRLARLMVKGKTMDKNNKVLYNAVQQAIRIAEKNIILE